MAVTRLCRLRGCGVFRDFEWPSNLLDFGRYNLIYGWNGSGKTTMSRLFRDIELRRPPTKGEATLRIDGSDVPGRDFPQSTVQIRVFNRDFTHESVFPVGDRDVPPIFVVGRESVEKQKETDRLTAERETKLTSLAAARQTTQDAESELDKHCIDRAKAIKDMLRSSASAYNDYDKRQYKDRTQQMAADRNAAAHRLTDSQRESALAQHQGTRKPEVREIAYGLPQLQDLADEVTALLGTTVGSAGIQVLKDDATLAEWSRHGLGLHKERSSAKCLFCEQPLPAGRLANLETHFNAEYERFLRRIDEQIQSLEGDRKQAAELRLPDRAALYDYLATEYDAAEQALRKALDTVQGWLGDLIKTLNDKKAQPFKALAPAVFIPELDAAVVGRLNAVIRRHNQTSDDFERQVSAARDRLALDMIAESVDDFVRHRDAVQPAEAAIGPIQAEIARLTDRITQLERGIREHQQPAEELNEDLKKYLGHGELQLTIKESGYAITRNGVPADMLSEGEMTAIALLYFLKSLQDRRLDLTKGVVVLDDPVSSLDANALYLAFGFIRERTKDAGQLFIFTHNFTFFRQVRNWFHYLKGQRKRDVSQRPGRFYMLDCAQRQDGRCASVRWLDPLLEQYESEYHYLFARVYRASSASGQTDLEENYALPNIARRLLEAFLAFRKPQVSGELWQKVQAVPFDEAKKLRILRFLHTHSHSDAVGEPEHDPSVLAEAGAVLQDLLEMVRSQDEAHFLAMVSLVAPPVSSGEDE